MTPDHYSRRYLSNNELRQSLYLRRGAPDWLWNLGCFLILLAIVCCLIYG